MSDNTMTTTETTETTTIPKKEPKKRATVEYNGMELVLALLVLYDDINTYGELLQKIQDMKENPGDYILTILFNDPNLALGENDDLKNYLADIVKKESIVNSFITRFRILSLKLPDETQGSILSKYHNLQALDPSSTEYYKQRNWLEKVATLPLGIYKQLPVKMEDGT